MLEYQFVRFDYEVQFFQTFYGFYEQDRILYFFCPLLFFPFLGSLLLCLCINSLFYRLRLACYIEEQGKALTM
ncbi:hypothetical protein [Phocaeicola barnesiae]|uniref:hypothetical protein n=1 Tax=Phocaeicola barnesiae TaxID=376804 RepID=UPI001F23507A|nr:hypothetical protein [Phocaeicola barnesiae]MDM8307737.1 hypothetical protein [Phocaeicola barnesiae]